MTTIDCSNLFSGGDEPIRAVLTKTLGPIKAAELVAELRRCEEAEEQRAEAGC